jgi:hypothetical protein
MPVIGKSRMMVAVVVAALLFVAGICGGIAVAAPSSQACCPSQSPVQQHTGANQCRMCMERPGPTAWLSSFRYQQQVGEHWEAAPQYSITTPNAQVPAFEFPITSPEPRFIKQHQLLI